MSNASISRGFAKRPRLTWMSSAVEFRPQTWLQALHASPWLTERLGVSESRRRLFHMSPALLPIALPLFPHPDLWGPILIGIVLASTAFGLMLATCCGHFMKRSSEEDLMSAAMGYAIPTTAALLLLPGRAELGLMTLQIVALGDGSAALGGMLLGGRRLPWNQNKTYTGLVSFVIAGTCAATWSYWGEANPKVSGATACLICGVAAVCAGIVESLPIRSSDNLRVGATALAVGMLMSTWFG